MRDLDAQIKAYASALAADSAPVTAEDVRRRRARRRPLGAVIVGVAAALLLVAGVSAALLQEGEDDVVSTDEGEFAHDLDGHRDWLVAMLNGDVEADDGALRDRFAASFLDEVPPDEFRQVADDLSGSAPWSVMVEVERREGALAVQLVGADDEQARLTLVVDGEGRIEGATVLAARPCDPLVDPETTEVAAVVDDRLAWVLEVLDTDRALADDELSAQFDDAFLAQVPPDELRRQIEAIRALGPFRVRWYEGTPEPSGTIVRLGIFSGEEAVLTMALASEDPFRIRSLTVHTQQPCVLADS